MKRHIMLAAAAGAALTLAACNRNADDDATTTTVEETTSATDAGTPAAATVNEADMPAATMAAGFVMRAALSDMYEIQSSQIALEKTQNADVRRYAEMMVKDHSRMTNEIQAAVRAQNLNVMAPPSLDQRRQAMIQQLRDASATDFDDRYLDQQTEAHENALNLVRDYAQNGDNEAFKNFARQGAPMIENHLQMVKALDAGNADDAAGANRPGAARP